MTNTETKRVNLLCSIAIFAELQNTIVKKIGLQMSSQTHKVLENTNHRHVYNPRVRNDHSTLSLSFLSSFPSFFSFYLGRSHLSFNLMISTGHSRSSPLFFLLLSLPPLFYLNPSVGGRQGSGGDALRRTKTERGM